MVDTVGWELKPSFIWSYICDTILSNAIAKNSKRSDISHYLQANKCVSWMLVEDMTLLDQRQSTIITTTAVTSFIIIFFCLFFIETSLKNSASKERKNPFKIKTII